MNKIWQAAAAATIGCALVLAPGADAQAADVRVLAVGAVDSAFKELVPQFEKASGHKLIVRYAATPVLAKQIAGGEAFDLAILVSGPMNDLVKQGAFAKGEPVAISSVALGAAVRAGSPKPDIGSTESFKQALLKAKSISLLPESVNGMHFLKVFERLGIAGEIKAKIKPQKDPPDVANAVAKGEAELALFISNLLVGVPGVDFVGPVPAEFQQTLVFTAAVGAKAKEPAAASALIKHLTSPAAAAVMKKHGMEVPQR